MILPPKPPKPTNLHLPVPKPAPSLSGHSSQPKNAGDVGGRSKMSGVPQESEYMHRISPDVSLRDKLKQARVNQNYREQASDQVVFIPNPGLVEVSKRIQELQSPLIGVHSDVEQLDQKFKLAGKIIHLSLSESRRTEGRYALALSSAKFLSILKQVGVVDRDVAWGQDRKADVELLKLVCLCSRYFHVNIDLSMSDRKIMGGDPYFTFATAKGLLSLYEIKDKVYRNVKRVHQNRADSEHPGMDISSELQSTEYFSNLTDHGIINRVHGEVVRLFAVRNGHCTFLSVDDILGMKFSENVPDNVSQLAQQIKNIKPFLNSNKLLKDLYDILTDRMASADITVLELAGELQKRGILTDGESAVRLYFTRSALQPHQDSEADVRILQLCLSYLGFSESGSIVSPDTKLLNYASARARFWSNPRESLTRNLARVTLLREGLVHEKLPWVVIEKRVDWMLFGERGELTDQQLKYLNGEIDHVVMQSPAAPKARVWAAGHSIHTDQPKSTTKVKHPNQGNDLSPIGKAQPVKQGWLDPIRIVGFFEKYSASLFDAALNFVGMSQVQSVNDVKSMSDVLSNIVTRIYGENNQPQKITDANSVSREQKEIEVVLQDAYWRTARHLQAKYPNQLNGRHSELVAFLRDQFDISHIVKLGRNDIANGKWDATISAAVEIIESDSDFVRFRCTTTSRTEYVSRK